MTRRIVVPEGFALLADAKAMAAAHGATVETSPYCPPGTAYVFDPEVFEALALQALDAWRDGTQEGDHPARDGEVR